MTSYLYPLSEVAPGYNNTGGLVPWESIVVNNVPFFAPIIYGSYSPGEEFIRADGTSYWMGFPAVTKGMFSAATQEQIYYVLGTLLGGNYSAPMTLKCRLEDPTNYKIINTIFRLSPNDKNSKKSMAWEKYGFMLTRIVVIG